MASESALVLQSKFAGVKLRTKWWGVTREVDDDTRDKMASAVGAAKEEISAKKRLVAKGDASYKGCTKVRSQARSWFKEISNPWPEEGVRLIRREDLEPLNTKIAVLQTQLDQAVAGLQARYREIIEERRKNQGTMFREGDYPQTLEGLFGIWVEFVSLEPPAYLQVENPRLYQQACERAAARFEEAVGLIENSMATEFKGFLDDMVDRLGYDEAGKPKRFKIMEDGRCPVVDNLRDFFGKFRTMSVGSSEELDALVNEAEQIVQGVKPESLRSAADTRQVLREGMAAIGEKLNAMVELRPARKVTFEDD